MVHVHIREFGIMFLCVGTFESTAKYPFSSVTTTYGISENNAFYVELSDTLPSDYKQAAQFFVTWGCFSLFYGIIAICVYMFTTALSKFEWVVNYLVLTVSYPLF